ncbi:MAG TPA: M48 family metalloprotease [Myxococcota bacterium]|nr:M48 family metalloprotease [Myxococcota bacterium]
MAAGPLRSLAPTLLLWAAALPWLSCVGPDGEPVNPLKKIIGAEVSVEQEREWGYEFDREIAKKVTLIDDPIVVGFLNDLGQDIVRGIEPQPFIYRFRVILDPTLNAFAVPGGYVYIHSGTILAASSLDELAGVVGHEIGHVKGRHIARMQEKMAIPQLLAGIVGMGAAVAAKNAGPAVAAQAVNVAMQLQFSREFEAEADDMGMTFMSRAGYDPQGMAHFFEKIQAEERPGAIEIPPYLYSHPALKDRIKSVETEAPTLRVHGSPPVELVAEMPEAQLRLTELIEAQRTSFAQTTAPVDHAAGDGVLAAAEGRAIEGDFNGAITVLAAGEKAEPGDPRIPFREGELLEIAGRRTEAIAAYRRTLRLDPTRAQVLYKMGLACKANGERHRAVFYLEQAERRFGEKSELQKKAAREVEKLTFRVVTEAGLADGSEARTADTAAGFSREAFQTSDSEAVWWAKVHARYYSNDLLKKMTVRWIDPSGAVHAETPVELRGRPDVVARLPIRPDGGIQSGVWTAEALFEGDVVDHRTFSIQPGP